MTTPTPKAPLPEPWPFDQPPNCAVVTTTHVIRAGEPITHVFHDEEDHGWQFHYPGEKSISDCMLVSLKTILHHDPTVAEVATMPPGHLAIREKVGSPWRIEKSPDERT